MKYKIMPTNWYKRRAPGTQLQITEFTVQGTVVLVEENYYQIDIKYDDGTDATVTGRLCHNAIANRWTLNGINSSGDYILLEVIPE
jgi:hypothetical protein